MPCPLLDDSTLLHQRRLETLLLRTFDRIAAASRLPAARRNFIVTDALTFLARSVTWGFPEVRVEPDGPAMDIDIDIIDPDWPAVDFDIAYILHHVDECPPTRDARIRLVFSFLAPVWMSRDLYNARLPDHCRGPDILGRMCFGKKEGPPAACLAMASVAPVAACG